MLVLAVTFVLLANQQVEAGKKDKMLMGLLVGHALHSRARDNSVLKLIVPLRLAAEAWRHYGEVAAYHGHGYHHHHDHGHYGHHLPLDYEHDIELGAHFKA